MKRLNYIVALMSVLLNIAPASAYEQETISNYTYDFNLGLGDGQTTLESGWAPPGWSHIVDKYNGSWQTYTVDYTYASALGVDNSGAVMVSTQSLGSWYSSYEAKDLLVTPLVSGTVTLQVKKNDYDGSIQFYNVDESGGSYAAGTLITDTTMNGALSTSSDTFITVTVDAGTTPRHIGVRASGVIIDNFKAASATLVKKPQMKIRSVSPADDQSVDADANGDFTVSYDVAIANTGLVDLTEGYPGYSLSLIRPNDSLVAEVPLTRTLKQGATDTVKVSKTLNISQFPAGYSYEFSIRENIDSVVTKAGSVYPVEYKPQFKFTEPGSSVSLNDSISLNFGMVKGKATKSYVIANDGAKALDITSITVPDGYTVLPAAPFSVEPHQQDTLTVQQNDDFIGEKSGIITLKMKDLPDYHILVSGSCVDSTKWFVNFEDNQIPKNVIAEGTNWAVATYPQQLELLGNQYCLYQDQYGEPSDHFISPKLHVAAGDVLQFMAARGGSATTPVLNVYYSYDRHNWTLVKTINTSDTIPEADRFSNETYRGSGYYANYKFKTFTLSNIPEGDVYVAFAGTYFYLDNLYGFTPVAVSHDIMMSQFKVPETISVNKAAEFSASAHNATVNNVDAGSYTVQLVIGDEHYDAEASKISAGGDASYTVSATPHKAGTFPAYFVYKTADGYVSTTDTVSVTIAPETTLGSHQVGTPDESSATRNGLLNMYDKKSQVVAVYKASDINLPAGTIIRGIALRGYNTKDFNSDVQLYFRSTDKTSMDATTAEDEIADTASFTRVYAGNYSFPKAGQGGGSSYNPTISKADDIFHVTFAAPYVYDGGNLEIAANHVSDSWSSILWESTTIEGQTAGRSNDRTLGSFEDWNLPVIYLDIERAPSAVSGTVTSASTSQPVPGVKVKLVSGNVEYADTTDAAGKYNVKIFQSNLKYNLTATRAGFTPVSIDTLSAAKDTTVNISLPDASGFYLLSKNIPANGEVNSAFKATAKAMNTEAEALSPSAYTATLYFGDKAVAQAKSDSIAAGAKADYTFAFTPHEAGQYKAYVKFAYGDKTTVSDTTDVTIGEETSAHVVRVNTPDAFTQNAPFYTYYKHGQIEVLYKASQLGLAPGTKIKRISFHGYHSTSNQSDFSTALTAYISNTTDETVKSAGTLFVDTTSMTCIVRDTTEATFSSSVGSKSEPEEVLSFEIPGGFVYTGGNIRLAFTNNSETGWLEVNYESDQTVDPSQTVYRFDDEDNVESKVFSPNPEGQPVAYLEVETKGSVSGKVVNTANEGIAGATVTLNNADVIYTGTTDADGNYSIVVKKVDRSYDATVEAAGYVSSMKPAAVKFGNVVNVEFNDTLTKYIAVSGTVKGVHVAYQAAKGYYNDTTLLAGATVTITDANGHTYTATTRADGTYTVDSLLENGTYAFKFAADGYLDKDTTVNAEMADITVDAMLWTQEATGIDAAHATGRKATGNVYSLNGKLIGRDLDLKALPRGVYIVDGKKFIVK